MSGGLPSRSNPLQIATSNPLEAIYIKGDETTDGSLRWVPDTTHGGEHGEIQYRANGAWNKSSIDVSGDVALSLGAVLHIGAAGSHLRSEDSNSGDTFLHTRTQYDAANGTAEAGTLPSFSAKVNRSILQPDDSGELTGSSINWTETLAEDRVITSLHLNVVTAPTDVVVFQVRSTDANGNLFFSRSLGTSELTVGEQEIEIPGWINEEGIGSVIYFSMTCDSGTIGLAADVNDTTPWYAYDYYTEDHSVVAPVDVTLEQCIFDDTTFEHILTTTGDIIAELPSTNPDGTI